MQTLGHFCIALDCLDIFITVKSHLAITYIYNCHAAVLQSMERYRSMSDTNVSIHPDDIATYKDLDAKITMLDKH
eukprot:3562752-Lingulodinium_polyedra.AAC.1